MTEVTAGLGDMAVRGSPLTGDTTDSRTWLSGTPLTEGTADKGRRRSWGRGRQGDTTDRQGTLLTGVTAGLGDNGRQGDTTDRRATTDSGTPLERDTLVTGGTRCVGYTAAG